MLALVTALRIARPTCRFVTLSLTLALVVGCSSKDTSGAGKSANTQTWAPDKLTSVQDVAATEIETLIQKKLDGRPGASSSQGVAERERRTLAHRGMRFPDPASKT